MHTGTTNSSSGTKQDSAAALTSRTAEASWALTRHAACPLSAAGFSEGRSSEAGVLWSVKLTAGSSSLEKRRTTGRLECCDSRPSCKAWGQGCRVLLWGERSNAGDEA
jgi:hypothetical protein